MLTNTSTCTIWTRLWLARPWVSNQAGEVHPHKSALRLSPVVPQRQPHLQFEAKKRNCSASSNCCKPICKMSIPSLTPSFLGFLSPFFNSTLPTAVSLSPALDGSRRSPPPPPPRCYCYSPVVWTSLGPLPRWVPGPTTRWAPGTTRLVLHGT
jgi:hypothetical protein